MSIVPARLFPLLVARVQRARSRFYMPAISCCLFVAFVLAACSLGGGGGGANTSTGTPLAHLHWCGGKPLMLFRDAQAGGLATPGASTPVASVTQASSTPATLTNWDQIKNQLGFTVYLPASLPAGTCLTSASGTLHDAVMGSRFSIGFVLPDHDSISLSEAPVQSPNQVFQCSPVGKIINDTSANATQSPVQLCTGVHNKTNIAFSARGTTNALLSFFQHLQPDINWVPMQ